LTDYRERLNALNIQPIAGACKDKLVLSPRLLRSESHLQGAEWAGSVIVSHRQAPFDSLLIAASA
jgi:hypothetical protein